LWRFCQLALAAAVCASAQDLSAASFRVVLNEIQYHPSDDSRDGEFVEIHNHGAEDIDLGGWLLSGGVVFRFPAGSMLASGGYLVVAASRQGLVARYGLDPALVAGEFSGSLDNHGDLLQLWSPGGILVASVDYGDSEPWPEAPDGLGPSLERVSPLREDADASAWSASILVGGTPGRENSAHVDDEDNPTGGDGIPLVLVPRGAVWRFLRGRAEPPPEWADADFDDSAWESGPAGFGYDRGDFTTTLADMQGNYTTFYCRRELSVQEPSRVESLTLNVTYDDGYVAYLNGTEIDRANAPGAPGSRPRFNDVATASVRIIETREVDASGSVGLLRAGRNVLAVHALNAAVDSRDFSIHASLGAVVSGGTTRLETVIPPGALWRFFRGREAPPSDWREVGFSDEAWEEGASGFGYGDNDDATVVDDMLGAYLTVFIRRSFEVADPEDVSEVVLDVDYDDGFVAYLNGIEVARSNVGSPGFDQPANASHEAGTPETFLVPLAPGTLRSGENVLALEGHNTDLTSSDFSLAPSLLARRVSLDPGKDPPPDEPLAPHPRDLVINEVAPAGAATGWVEVYNPTTEEVDATGRRLLRFPAALGDFTFPQGTRIAAGGRLLVSEVELGFELEGPSALILAAENGSFIDAVQASVVPPRSRSLGRFPDGGENALVLRTPTPGGPNLAEPEAGVVIHEIQYHPADANTGGEWIELFNRSESPVDLSGWSFTRGIQFVFPGGTVIPAGGYLVVARDADAVERRYGIDGVLGPWEGALRNDAETLLLRDALGNPADRVRYADEGSWPENTDGLGPSVELVHPTFENRYGAAWRASSGEGSPGAPNSRFEADPAVIVAGVEHSPIVPGPTDRVRVLATVSAPSGVRTATLFYQPDGAGGAATALALADDGISDDGIAANSVFGAEVPPHPNRSVVAFWIRAEGENGLTVTAPAGAPAAPFLYQVETPEPRRSRPLYRVVMRAANLNQLQTRNRGSDVLLDTTFIAGGKAHYNRGIRYRGSSARNCDPLSYRVQFDHDVSLHGIKRLNLNGCSVHRQYLGLDFLSRTDVPTPAMWLRHLALNGQVEDDIYLRVEVIDDAFLERTLEGNDGGNLYRGANQANLDYRGTNAGSYRGDYVKRTNEEADDYSDVFDLCFRFDDNTTADDDFPPAVEERVDVEEWALFFAAFAVLGSSENSIVLDNGDDYFLYHRPADDKWMLLPWDLDSCYDDAGQVLFRPTVDAIERFLRHPRYASEYWCRLESLLDTVFDPDFIESRIERVAPFFSPGAVTQLRNYVAARRGYILARLRSQFTVEIAGGATLCGGVVFRADADLRLRGTAPSCGTAEVWVNGVPASYDAVSGAWNITLADRSGSVLRVTTHTRDGSETARVEYPVVSPSAFQRMPDSITNAVTLRREDGPYYAAQDVFVAPGARLTIEAGVRVYFSGNASLLVGGTLVVEGSELHPVILEPDNCGGTWGGILFTQGSRANRLAHCDVRGLTQAPGSTAGVWVLGGELRLDAARLETRGAAAVLVENGGSLELAGSTVTAGGGAMDGVIASGATAALSASEIRGFPGVALTATDALSPGISVDDCTIRDSGAGIQCRGSALRLSSSRFHDLASAAVHVTGASAVVEDSVFWSCADALILAGDAVATCSHLTVNGCARGLVLEAPLAGRAASAAAHSLIVWTTPSPVLAGAGTAIDLTFSDTSAGVLPGQGNISADPLFADPTAFDFRLLASSPCRGAGRDSSDMGALPVVPGAGGNRYQLCDSSGDGQNNLSDAVFTLRFLFAGPQGRVPSCLSSADCDADGRITLSDAVFNLRYLFQGGPRPRAPYPDCEEALAEECGMQTCVN
jgi:hypothetical protein